MSYLKPQVSFSLNFASLFNVMSVSLLYFFSWNFILFLQNEPTKVKNFRLSTPQVKFHEICTVIGSFCWNYIKFLRKMYRGVMSRDIEEWCKIWRFFVSKMTRIWWILIRALKSLKNFRFDWSLLCKVYNVWPKKVQRRYNSWHFSVMQNLKKNWLVVWKITRGIWQIFTSAHGSLKIGTFIRFFCPKEKKNLR